MKFKKSDKGLPKPKLTFDRFGQIIFTLKEVFRLSYNVRKGVFISVIIFNTLWGLSAVPGFYLEKLIIDKLISGVGTSDWSDVFYPVLFLTALALLLSLFSNFLGALSRFLRENLSRYFDAEIDMQIGSKMARMVEAGQDPLYIARRMVVFASEDIGMAQPTALVVANDVFRACETIGYPECQENLAHGVVYLASAKKDRSSYEAYMKALEDVRTYGNLPVPLKIRNPVTKLMKDVGYGEGYEKYADESLLPNKLKGKKYYPK